MAKTWEQFEGATGLEDTLAAAPDPDRARKLADRLLEVADPDRLRLAKDGGLSRLVAAACGVAPYLTAYLARHPDWLHGLVCEELVDPVQKEPLTQELTGALAATRFDAETGDAERVLREFKYRHLARISVRESDPELVPLEREGEVLAELSRLADVLLEGALQVARARVEARLGPPRWRDADGQEREAGFVILGLGKLGGEELNYSSDVDLIYVHEAVVDAGSGPQERSPSAWFTRLAQELGPLVTQVTKDGFLYRVDLDLRPEGTQGPLVLSEEAFESYYETGADGWEKVAFMKARPVAGDLDLGWRTIRAIHPMIYQASMDYRGVQRIRELKEKIGLARGNEGEAFDVKLDPGGIRDLEFLAQAMQLLHGGRILQLRGRSTQRTLQALAEVKLLPAETVEALLRAYRFLRRVENRLQMEEERQVHRLPTRPEARLRLARSLGYRGDDGVERFDADLAAERERVQRFAGLAGFPERADAILELFARHESGLLRVPGTRAMMETLSRQFGREIDASPAPQLAMNNLDRFIDGLGGRRFYYELLLDRPELVPRLAALFGSSRHLSALLASYPRLIEPVFDNPERLLLSREELRADLVGIVAQLQGDAEATGDSGAPENGEPDFESGLEALRLFHHRQVINVGLLDVADHVSRAEAEAALSDIAEVILEASLALARSEQRRIRGEPEGLDDAGFVVVGMGKLASRELSYGSDLDLIFLYDLADPDPALVAEAQDHFARLAQRLISVLQTPTSEGACYEIDPRLRPSGRQGSLVTSLDSFRRYHEGEAAIWERQILLRARAVAGDAACANSFETMRRALLVRPLAEDPAEEIHRIRLRMENELAGETRQRRDLKTGRGGLLDVENAVQYLLLRAAADPEAADASAESAALLEPARIETQIARLREAGRLGDDHAAVLDEGWEFLQRLASRLRIVENRSISELDDERGDLDGLALRLGYPGGGRESGPRRAMLRDYARHTEAIRRAYGEILGVEV